MSWVVKDFKSKRLFVLQNHGKPFCTGGTLVHVNDMQTSKPETGGGHHVHQSRIHCQSVPQQFGPVLNFQFSHMVSFRMVHRLHHVRLFCLSDTSLNLLLTLPFSWLSMLLSIISRFPVRGCRGSRKPLPLCHCNTSRHRDTSAAVDPP